MNDDIIQILTEEMDEETLSQMPLWLGVLRLNYGKRHSEKSLSDIKK